jgi:hypothetical protein
LKRIAVIAVVILLCVSSCVKKNIPEPPAVPGLDYYPVTEGKYVIYEVDSTVYTELPRDTVQSKYLIKEKIADSFTDNEGKEARRIERYIKKFDPLKSYDSTPWTMKEVYLLNADNKKIQVQEGNIRFTKLIFPVEPKASWNGNAGNTKGEQFYAYEYVDRHEAVGKITLDNVLMVKQFEYSTLISYQNYNEKYAKGVGLVAKEITDLLSNNVIAGKPVTDRIESGIIYKQTLVTYGYE